jgi:hypothetical protein
MLFAPKASRDFYVCRFNRMQSAPREDCCDPDWSVGAPNSIDASNSSALARFSADTCQHHGTKKSRRRDETAAAFDTHTLRSRSQAEWKW